MNTEYSKSIFNCDNDPFKAAVGLNGNPDIDYYADGFSESVKLMIEALIIRYKKRKLGDYSVCITEDILVYPICFNIRHSIELYLKSIIQKVRKIQAYRGGEKITTTALVDDVEYRDIQHHDILILWNTLCKYRFSGWSSDSEVERKDIFDETFDLYLNNLEYYIDQWGSIDPTGQTFRYPFSTDSKKHLAGVNTIGIASVCLGFKKNTRILKRFSSFLDSLYDDLTKNRGNCFLTYNQLIELANDLPKYDSWENDLTSNLKGRLREKFKLGSNNKLNLCINYIKKDYHLSSLIGMDIPFRFLSKEKLIEFYNFFSRFRNQEEMQASEESLKKILFQSIDSCNNKEINSFLDRASNDELIDFIAIVYLGKDKCDVQKYSCLYESIKCDMAHTGKKDDYYIDLCCQCKHICDYLDVALLAFSKKYFES